MPYNKVEIAYYFSCMDMIEALNGTVETSVPILITAILELSVRISMKAAVQPVSTRQKCLIMLCRICAAFFARIMRLPIFKQKVL